MPRWERPGSLHATTRLGDEVGKLDLKASLGSGSNYGVIEPYLRAYVSTKSNFQFVIIRHDDGTGTLLDVNETQAQGMLRGREIDLESGEIERTKPLVLTTAAGNKRTFGDEVVQIVVEHSRLYTDKEAAAMAPFPKATAIDSVVLDMFEANKTAIDYKPVYRRLLGRTTGKNYRIGQVCEADSVDLKTALFPSRVLAKYTKAFVKTKSGGLLVVEPNLESGIATIVDVRETAKAGALKTQKVRPDDLPAVLGNLVDPTKEVILEMGKRYNEMQAYAWTGGRNDFEVQSAERVLQRAVVATLPIEQGM